ncbi:MAG: acyl-CoA dehydrogenase family protein [Dehalococcoidia bacterium]
MDLNLTEEQKMIRETAHDLALLELGPRAEEADGYYLFPWDGVRQLAEAGLMGMLLPPPYGGSGADTLSFVLAAEELAQGCANTALVFVTHVAASRGVLIGGQDPLKGELLPLLAKGEKLLGFAATEADSGANPIAIQTTAKLDGDHYVVNGSKIYITGVEEMHYYLTVLRTAPGPGPAGLSALIIEKDIPGFSTGRKFLRLGMNGTASGELFFADCSVPRGHLVGEEGNYLPLGFAVGTVAVLGASAIAVGLAQAALDATLQHGKQRVIAGQPLGNYQAVQLMVAEMSVAVEAARNLLYGAVFAVDNAPPGPPIAAMKAKLFCTEMALQVIDKALRVHGGQGYTKEFPLERYYRDARGLTLHFTPTEMLKAQLGQMLMGLMP